MFYPDKALGVQVTVNHTETSDKSYVYDAVVSWVKNVSYNRFTACMMAAGYNERHANANVTVDWMVYQGTPVGGVADEVRLSQWWTGTTCKSVSFLSVGKMNYLIINVLKTKRSFSEKLEPCSARSYDLA